MLQRRNGNVPQCLHSCVVRPPRFQRTAFPAIETFNAAALVCLCFLLMCGHLESADRNTSPHIQQTQASPSPLDQTPESTARPDRLRDPDEQPTPQASPFDFGSTEEPLFLDEVHPPLGFTGPSGILPRDGQEDSHFVPLEDRWRIGFPDWDRYQQGHPHDFEYPYVEGHWWDPYHQNVLKGDYPLIGQHTFLNLTASLISLQEPRLIPKFNNPDGNPNQFFSNNFLRLQADLIHGTGAFKPVDWQMRIAPVFNLNVLQVQQPGLVEAGNFDATRRVGTIATLEEYWLETKLADLSPNYDFVSLRVGSQPFNSDFRGFIFSDINRAVRLYGNRHANREQYNVALFSQAEKDRYSQLNTFEDRRQQIVIANYYLQDLVFPGFTGQASFHWNHDHASTQFDKAGFPARPDPVGAAQPHRVDAYYFGLAGDGPVGLVNLSHALYWVTGNDSLNPLAGQEQTINAQMAAVELSYDWDWIRFRTSGFWASGDGNPNDGAARGFDSILDDPNFAGGQFSYWQRQALPIKGVGLTNRRSLVADLRSSKFQGQSNFVNPGVTLANGGMDFFLTQKVKLVSNVNYLWFDRTAVLEQLVGVPAIDRRIGLDTSLGLEYRPLLNNNVIIMAGLAGLFPAKGLRQVYDPATSHVPTLYSSFIEFALTY